MTSFLANLGLAKIQHNWAMDIADKKIAAATAQSNIEAQRATALQETKGKQAMARTEKTVAGRKKVAEIGAGKLTGPEQKKKMLMDMFPGLDEGTATKLSLGQIVTGQDAMGRTVLVDRVANKIVPVQGASGIPGATQTPPGPGGVPSTPQPGGFQITPEIAQAGMGPKGSFKESINNMFGWMTKGLPFPNAAHARQMLRTFAHHVKSGIMMNPKFPVAEMKEIQGFIPDVNKFFRDPDDSVQKLIDLKSYLLTKRQQKQTAIESRQISADQIKEYSALINNYDGVLSMLQSIPDVGSANMPDVTKMSDAELDKIISGGQ
jgi:hypothetical protein